MRIIFFQQSHNIMKIRKIFFEKSDMYYARLKIFIV